MVSNVNGNNKKKLEGGGDSYMKIHLKKHKPIFWRYRLFTKEFGDKKTVLKVSSCSSARHYRSFSQILILFRLQFPLI